MTNPLSRLIESLRNAGANVQVIGFDGSDGQSILGSITQTGDDPDLRERLASQNLSPDAQYRVQRTIETMLQLVGHTGDGECAACERYNNGTSLPEDEAGNAMVDAMIEGGEKLQAWVDDHVQRLGMPSPDVQEALEALGAEFPDENDVTTDAPNFQDFLRAIGIPEELLGPMDALNDDLQADTDIEASFGLDEAGTISELDAHRMTVTFNDQEWNDLNTACYNWGLDVRTFLARAVGDTVRRLKDPNNSDAIITMSHDDEAVIRDAAYRHGLTEAEFLDAAIRAHANSLEISNTLQDVVDAEDEVVAAAEDLIHSSPGQNASIGELFEYAARIGGDARRRLRTAVEELQAARERAEDA